MKRFFALVLMGAALLFGGRVAAAQEEVYGSISPSELKTWMQAAGYSVSIDGDGDIKWMLDDYKSYITFYKENKSIQFFIGFNSDQTTLEKMNEFNLKYRFGRSMIPKAGTVRLEVDLDLDGGVTKARIMDYVKTCVSLTDTWRKMVL